MIKPFFTSSLLDAKRNDKVELWRMSHQANVECARDIEKTLSEKFDGMHLAGDTAETLVKEYGMSRLMWVLANTVQHQDWDGRFRTENKEWAKQFQIPKGEANDYTTAFVVNSHPEIVNGLINQVKRYQENFHEEQNEEMDFGQEVSMKIRLFQIEHELDKNRVKFEGHESAVKHGGAVDPSIYQEVFAGEVDCGSLDDIYKLFNENHPLTHRGHSLSVSDVCEIIESPILTGRILFYAEDGSLSGTVDYTDSKKYNQAILENQEQNISFKAVPLSDKNIPVVEKGTYFCDSVGWKKIDFDPSQTTKPDNLLRIVMVEPNKAAYVAEIEDKLEALQRAVGGGLIEVTYPLYDEGRVLLFSNDEAKLIGMEGNRKINDELYAGPFFLALDDGQGGTISLTDELVEKYLERFKEPEQYTSEDVQDSIYFMFGHF